ncbi:MAG: Acetolactate synthase isozyme 2 small subunit [Candidatus Erwinia impunctatus]|nr:Acetolactate synthase isozyme 2 small subunit [Culicoides impunctatus]
MIQHQLSVEAKAQPEILERLFRVVRHRGFQVMTMNMVSEKESGTITLDMTVSSQRCIDLLLTQLGKLPDVSAVHLRQNTTQQICA